MSGDSRWTRRTILRVGSGVAASALMAACGGQPGVERPPLADTATPPAPEVQPTAMPTVTPPLPGAQATEGRLTARPMPVTERGPDGLRSLEIVAERDVLLYVPSSYQPDQPAPCVVLLHGAHSNASSSLRLMQSFADERGLILIGAASRGSTWDVIRGSYGPDITVLDRALAQVFAAYAVDPQRLAIGGFSDGGSYALSVGLANGDLFPQVIAFSPGFIAPATRHGTPRFFISHGTRDEVLPIERCSRRIVPELQRAGYDVRYQEFDGPHIVPTAIAGAAVDWYLST